MNTCALCGTSDLAGRRAFHFKKGKSSSPIPRLLVIEDMLDSEQQDIVICEHCLKYVKEELVDFIVRKEIDSMKLKLTKDLSLLADVEILQFLHNYGLYFQVP